MAVNLLAAQVIPKIAKTGKGSGTAAYTSRSVESMEPEEGKKTGLFGSNTYAPEGMVRTPYGFVEESEYKLSPAQLINIAGGFAPGAATAENIGEYPDFPEYDATIEEMFASEEMSPSLKKNFDEGNYGTALLQGIGQLGDVAAVLPFIGAPLNFISSVPRAVQKGIEALGKVKSVEDVTEDAIRFADEMKDFKRMMEDKSRYYDPEFQAATDAHPVVKRSLEQMGEIPETSLREDFLTRDFMDSRPFNFGDMEVVGYDDAVEELYRRARRLGFDDAKPKIPYPGPVTNSPDATKRAVIILGPPASGKSTIANPIARKFDAAIIDPDEAKKLLPEYKGGVGANAVHSESKAIIELVQEIAMEQGDNIVIPTVGQDLGKLRTQIKTLKDRGYEVDVVDVVVPAADARIRMYGRFADTGRIIPAKYLDEVGDNPSKNYDILREEGIADGYTRIDNTAPVEQPRALLEDTREVLEGTELRLRDSRRNGGALRPESANAGGVKPSSGPIAQGEGRGLAGLGQPEMPASNQFFDPSDPAFKPFLNGN
jgi:adenylate kinase family enzyme